MKVAKSLYLNNMVAVIKPAEEGGFYAYCPAIPGCASQGETYLETVQNITEAIEGALEVLLEENSLDVVRPIFQDNMIVNIPVKVSQKFMTA